MTTQPHPDGGLVTQVITFAGQAVLSKVTDLQWQICEIEPPRSGF